MRRLFPNSTPWIEYGAVALGAVLVTIGMTWPLVPHAWDHVLRAIYHWDAYTNAMIMGCRADAVLGRGPLSLYDNYFFAPLANSIVFNENHFGLSLLFFPFYVTTNNPLLAYNVTLLLSLAGSVFCTTLLIRRLTGNTYAGFLVGVGFAFCPYVTFELGRIQLVATQWIPLAFLLLHRALEERRPRDLVAFWVVYVLQIGTCLYYAMFLIPLLTLVGAVLLFAVRGKRSFYVWLVACPVVAGIVALLMVYPYFAERHAFDLERSLKFASGYDGKLAFFGHVHETNRTLTWMHHPSIFRGAYEEIAFPGFALAFFGLLAVALNIAPLVRNGRLLAQTALVLVLAVALTLVSHSMLPGLIVCGAALWWRSRKRIGASALTTSELYSLVLVVAVLMFLGLAPLHWQGRPVHGLYYYFHTYFPGFNGIRKVSRQAVMVTFVLAVLAGCGLAWVLARLPRDWHRSLAFGVLLAGVCYELRIFPHPLQVAWAGQSVPSAYPFIRTLPEDELIAVMPQNEGVHIFRGDDGLAYHNYLALYHKHRFVNGQSSWAPQVTDLALRTQWQLPHPDAHRVLAMIGVRHLLIHAGDLPEARRNLPELLKAQPERYQHVFSDGTDHVFSLVVPNDPSLALREVPLLPSDAQRVPSVAIRPESAFEAGRLPLAVDDNVATRWSSLRAQRTGHFFGVALDRPRNIVAFEIVNPWHEMFLPASYTLYVSIGDGKPQRVVSEPNLRLFRDQIHTPKAFRFRIVLPEPMLADRMRLVVEKPLPGYDFVVHEVHVYERAR